jgi:AcrR family transcriptional regulator
MLQHVESGLEVVSTRERILRATREVFERNGTRGTTTREVAERAGVNEATLFRHFGNKIALLEAMREWSIDNSGLTLTSALDALGGDLRADLTAICMTLYEGMLRNQAIIRISLAEEQTDPEGLPSCLRGPTLIMQRLGAYLQSQLDAGKIRGNPRQLAALIMGTMFALAMKSKRIDWGDEGRPEALIPAFVDTILNGVKT